MKTKYLSFLLLFLPLLSMAQDYGYHFDGLNNVYLVQKITAYNLGLGDFTMEAYVNIDAGAPGGLLFGDGPMQWGMIGGDMYYYGNTGYGQTQGLGLNDGNCHKLALVRNSGNRSITFYVDGENVGGGYAGSDSVFAASNNIYPLEIGNSSVNGVPLAFLLKEIRFWGTALTQVQIQAAQYDPFNQALANANLLGLWQFNENQWGDYSIYQNNPLTNQFQNQNPTLTLGCSLCNPSFKPAVNIHPNNYAPCSGKPLRFSASPSNGGFSPAYQWQVNGKNIYSQTDSVFTISTLTSSDAVTCVMTSNESCLTGSNAVTSNTEQLQIFVTVPIGIIVDASAFTTMCSGTPITFTPHSNYPGIYQWKINGAVVSTGNQYTTSSLKNNDKVSCMVTVDSTGDCFSNNPATSTPDTFTIVSPKKTTITPASQVICPGLTATLQSPDTYYYSWSTGATTQNISGLGAGSYSVTAFDNNGCSTATATVSQGTCRVPANISAGSITTNSAKITWAVQPCAFTTQIHYRVNGASTWSTVGITVPLATRTINNLSAGTKYDLQLRTKCSQTGNVYSAWSTIQNFTTTQSCNPPGNLTATNLQQTQATISWLAAGGAYAYRLRLRAKGSITWTTRTILAPTVTKILTGLVANTAYEYQVQTICSASGTPASTWSAVKTFNTALRLEGESLTEQIDFIIYPNPATGYLIVSGNPLAGGEISVADLLGRTYLTQIVSSETTLITLDVGNFAAGLYFVRLHTANGDVVKKFVKQ